MAERIKVTVRPSGAHPDLLTVQDAMRQVLDVFDLVATDEIAWRLVDASMNSPFWAEGEAVSLVPEIDIGPIARAQKEELSRNLRSLILGNRPAEWYTAPRDQLVRQILSRNMNGIGETDIDGLAGDDQPVVITPAVAAKARQILDIATTVPDDEDSLYPERGAHDEFGSIDGTLCAVAPDYEQPAIRVKDRLTGDEITCRISEEIAQRISRQQRYKDVWAGQRVRVSGRIRYSKSGDVVRVYADDVRRLTPRDINIGDIHDPNFTGGLSIEEYLERFRDGELAP